ncbi:hypothetical protein NSQ89_04290 [Niallia sp. FSL R7-0648]
MRRISASASGFSAKLWNLLAKARVESAKLEKYQPILQGYQPN